MPGKCLSTQTEGDKCCWRGHDKLATVNLRTRSPTGGPWVDTILHDCWMCLTALMKGINKKWEAPSPLNTITTHTQLQPPLPFYCKLFDVSLFLLDSLLRFWSRFDFLWHIWYILWKQYKPSKRGRMSLNFNCCEVICLTGQWQKYIFSTLAAEKTKSKPVPKKSYKLDECIKFPHTGVDFFSKWLLSQVWQRKGNIVLSFQEHQKIWVFLL